MPPFLGRRAFFSVEIDFEHSLKEEGYSLSLIPNEDPNGTGQRVLEAMRIAIREMIPEQLWKSYRISVKTEITNTRQGSIIIDFMAVLIGIYYFVSRYKSFIEGCILLRQQTEQIVKALLKKEHRGLEARVTIVRPFVYRDPIIIRRDAGYLLSDFRGKNLAIPLILSLLMSIFLILFLGLLVWKAVWRVYLM